MLRPKTHFEQVPLEIVRKIAEEKIQDMNANDLEAATMIVLGTARSMGIDLIEE